MDRFRNNSLSRHGIGLMGGLVVQYILGMLTNLYVSFPENGTVNQNWEFTRGQWLVLAHILIGLLLIFGTASLYVRAIRAKDRTWKIAGGIAAGSVILAFVSGEEFVSNQSDVYSFAMSLFFILALGSIAWGVYKTKE